MDYFLLMQTVDAILTQENLNQTLAPGTGPETTGGLFPETNRREGATLTARREALPRPGNRFDRGPASGWLEPMGDIGSSATVSAEAVADATHSARRLRVAYRPEISWRTTVRGI